MIRFKTKRPEWLDGLLHAEREVKECPRLVNGTLRWVCHNCSLEYYNGFCAYLEHVNYERA